MQAQICAKNDTLQKNMTKSTIFIIFSILSKT